jgi:hypothetical protein
LGNYNPNAVIGEKYPKEMVAQTTTSCAVIADKGTMELPESKVPLLLPPSDDRNKNVTSIQLGETISFAQLGPIILNADGTTRRIDNWNSLSKQEQEVTWRRIKKRNAERREKLLQQQKEHGQQSNAEQSENNTNVDNLQA